MKKFIKISFLLLIALSAVTSCKKEGTLHADLSALDRDVIQNTALDTWLDQNYLTPYNIQVKYRWDAFEAALDKTLVPPKESQVQPTMEAIRDIWIRTYERAGGPEFMKNNTPKQFYLVGSPSYNGDGTITLGTAEGGKKIVLFIINNFSKTNSPNLHEMIHVIEHEFTHILNQKIPYAPAFNTLSAGYYTGNWNLFDLATARSLGFISQYSRAQPLEDFAEMTSMMLNYGSAAYNNIANTLPAGPQAVLRAKEAYVVSYFKTAWSIDFYAMQTDVSATMDSFVPALNTSVGTGKTFGSFLSIPLTANALAPQSASFLTAWNTSKTAMTTAGFGITQYQIIFNAGTSATLRYSFTSAGTTYLADLDLTMVTDANGITTLTPNTVQGTGSAYSNYGVIKTAMTAVTNYITTNQFKFDYAPTSFGQRGIPGSSIGGFYKATDPTAYLIGTLN